MNKQTIKKILCWIFPFLKEETKVVQIELVKKVPIVPSWHPKGADLLLGILSSLLSKEYGRKVKYNIYKRHDKSIISASMSIRKSHNFHVEIIMEPGIKSVKKGFRNNSTRFKLYVPINFNSLDIYNLEKYLLFHIGEMKRGFRNEKRAYQLYQDVIRERKFRVSIYQDRKKDVEGVDFIIQRGERKLYIQVKSSINQLRKVANHKDGTRIYYILSNKDLTDERIKSTAVDLIKTELPAKGKKPHHV